MLHTPGRLSLHLTYADVLYTLGGPHLKEARQYYASALQLSGGKNLRALYGAAAATAALAAAQKVRFVFRTYSDNLLLRFELCSPLVAS